MDIKQQKTLIRKNCKQRLSNVLTSEQKEIAKKQIIKHLKNFLKNLQNNIKSIYVYYPMQTEVDLTDFYIIASNYLELRLPIIKNPQNSKVTLTNTERKLLNFQKWKPGDKIQKNTYGFYEPIKKSTLDLNIPDVLILPLLAFDKLGNRLGRGAGFYDYTLAHYPDLRNTCKICCAFAIQEYDNIPIEQHDVPVNFIITENGIIKCK